MLGLGNKCVLANSTQPSVPSKVLARKCVLRPGIWLISQSGPMRFLDFWSTKMWPVLSAKYGELLERKPRKQDDGASGRSYKELYKLIGTKKKIDMVTCNLAWTDPVGNTVMQEDISLAMVENFVLDTFMDNSMRETAESAVDSEVAVSADALDPSGEPSLDPANAVTHRDQVMSRKMKWCIPSIHQSS